MKQLIVIEGPTASGKTALSVAVASHFSTVILSADSRQFYKEMTIGTAKPDLEEQQGIPHYFIDSHSVTEEFTAAQFAHEARAVLDQKFKVHDVVVLVGGSGMFIDALCSGLDDIPRSPELRETLNKELKEKGLDALLTELKMKDPIFFDQVDRKNPVRVIRALEAIRLTGKPFSTMRTSGKVELPFQVRYFIIDHERDALYGRINDRVDQMISKGLVDEARKLLPFRDQNALRTVGYQELFSFFDGTCSLDEAIDQIKQNSRNYAKRQITWFKKHKEAVHIPFSATSKMLVDVLTHIKTT